MARSVVRLEGDEIHFFHINYFYMWKKLNTAPYYVNGNGETPKWIKDPELLPSYVNLSKCMNPDYVPSMNIVNKIVQFYNANITPEINTFQFLHEKLESTDSQRHANGGQISTSKYHGIYYGYYYSGIPDQKIIFGAILRVFEANGIQAAQMITGISSPKDMQSMRLKSLISKDSLTLEDYQAYRDSLELSKKRTLTLYKGVVTLTQESMFFQMQGIDRDSNWLFFNCVPSGGFSDDFIGGMGLMTFINGNFDIQLLKMGIVSADNKELIPFSYDDEKLKSMLALNKSENERIHLSMQQNSVWGDIAIQNGRE